MPNEPRLPDKGEKIIPPNNLWKIRKKLEYSQKEMAEILGVTERMISNYERYTNTLPIEKAILLSETYNYSLDWIYCIETTQKNNAPIHSDSTQLDSFLVDIRDFIFLSNDKIHLIIPENYWNYINELSSIMASSKTSDEKERAKAELNGEYKTKNKSNKIWRISIPIEQISSYLHFDSKFIPFVDNESIDEHEPTEEQVEEAISFLKNLTKNKRIKLI